MKFFSSKIQITPRYWHKQSKKVRQRINESPNADQLKRNLFKQPKWCLKPDASIYHVKDGEVTGCWVMELRPECVSNRQCLKKNRLEGRLGSCPFHVSHPNNILLRPVKRKPVQAPKKKESIPSIAKYAREHKEVKKAKNIKVLYKVSAILVVFWAVGYYGFDASVYIHLSLWAAGVIALLQLSTDLKNWFGRNF